VVVFFASELGISIHIIRCREFTEENKLIKEQNEQHLTIVQVLQDEMHALQLELLKMENRVRDLEVENKTLIERWLRKIGEEALKMNEDLTPSQR
jgi:hypothetical protein